MLTPWLVALVAAAFPLVACGAQTPATVKVVLDNDYPPYSFLDKNGDPQGILKDLWSLWEKRTGIHVDYRPMEWNRALATMKSGQGDVIDTIFDTPARREVFDFSEPYASLDVNILFQKALSGITNADSLRGFTVGVKAGDACIDYLITHGISNLKPYPSYDAEVDAAIRNDIKVMCIDKPPAVYWLNRQGKAEDFRFSPPLYVGRFHWAVAKGRTDLKRVIEEGFSRITPAERNAIYKRWLGEAVPRPHGIWLEWVVYTAASLALIVIVLVVWNRALQSRVADRTRELSETLDSLKESENKLRTVLDNVDAYIYLKDVQGRYLFANAAVRRFLEMEMSDIIGFGDEKFFDAETAANVRANDRRVLVDGETLRAEETNTMATTGRTYTYQSVKLPLRRDDGSIYALCGISVDITERKQSEVRLAQLNADMSATLLAIPDLLFELSEAGAYINVWARNPDLLVAQKDLLFGRTVHDILPPAAAETVMSSIREASLSGTSFGKIIALELPDSRHWFELSTSAKSVAGQQHRHFMMLSREITGRVLAEEALRESEQRYRTLLDATGAVIWSCSPSGLLDRPQPQWTAFTGQSAEEVRGASWTSAVHPDDLAIANQRWQQAVETRQPLASEHRIRRHDGEWRWMKVYGVPIRNTDGQVVEWFGMNLDLTERKQAEEKIEHMAYHDQLTGLPNRALFLDRLTQTLAGAQRAKRHGAIIFIDLDQFKKINDVYGHVFGDAVLKEVAGRLGYFVRQGDTVARFGGDEFVILLPELSTDQAAAATQALSVAEKLRAALEEPSRIEGQAYASTASIGISLFPRHSKNVDDLIREADIAMYRAKERGRNTLIFFEDDMQLAITERFAIEQELREAVRRNELELYLQSQVNVDGRVTGAESLLRWRHPTRGLIPPAVFIPLAEETGLIATIGEWVLRETCRVIAQLNAMGRSYHFAVNVSPRQFNQADFVTRVKDILAETGADPVYLTLEFTENLVVGQTSEIVSRMLALSGLGIRFSIDDFGTGYSSLSYLKRLPLNELKIDKSFVQDIPNDPNDVALVETILSMAHHLGFAVVAEGVENIEQFKFLAAHHCEHFQGYFFHRPQPAQEWLAQLNDRIA